MHFPLSRPLRAAIIVLSILIGSTALWYNFRCKGFHFMQIDLLVYLAGAREYLGEGNLYGQLYRITLIELPFTYPPFGALIFTPISILPTQAFGVFMNLVMLLALGWSSFVILDRARMHNWLGLGAAGPADMRCLTIGMTGLSFTLHPIIQNYEFGQINFILMALVLTDALRPPRRLPQGVLTGIAAAIKLTPAVFIIYFLFTKRFRAAATMVISAIAATLIAAIPHPATTWEYFTHTLSDPGRIGNTAYAYNQSINALLVRLQAPHALWYLGVAAILALVIAAVPRLRARGMDEWALVSVAFIALLCSPVSWSHHWCWLLIAISLAFFNRYWLLGCAGIFLCSKWGVFFPSFPQNDGAELTWAWWQQVLGNLWLLWALVFIARPLGKFSLTGAGCCRPGPASTPEEPKR